MSAPTLPVEGPLDPGDDFSRRLRPISIAIILLISVVFPAAFFIVEYRNLTARGALYAQNIAEHMREVIGESPSLWKYQIYRNKELMSDTALLHDVVTIDVLDEMGKQVDLFSFRSAEAESFSYHWAPTAKAGITYNNNRMGEVVVTLSQKGILARAAIIEVVSSLTGAALALLAYLVPLRIVKRREERIKALVDGIEERNRQMEKLQEMGELFQSCHASDDVIPVLDRTLRKLFPDQAGSLGLVNNSRTLIDFVVRWGDVAQEEILPPDECWVLRRGKIQLSDDAGVGVPCDRFKGKGIMGSFCVPIQAGGETLGVFALRYGLAGAASGDGWRPAPLTDDKKRLAMAVADHTAMTLASLRLRETLRTQSIQDPLTGLFNRRHMEKTLEMEIARAERKSYPLAVMMLDLDHFKRLNDTYGHEAGDMVLRRFATHLLGWIRQYDVVCRYGGEEFLVIFPGLPPEMALVRGEEIRRKTRSMDMKIDGGINPIVTVSVGVAVYPDHVSNGQDLVNAADKALYAAKKTGRDRIVMASRKLDERTSVLGGA